MAQQLSDLEKGQLYPPYVIHALENAGETKFLPDLVKIEMDQTIFEVLKKVLEEVEEKSDMRALGSVGHRPMHAARLYRKNKDKIPEADTALHERGNAVVNLSNVYYGDQLEQAVPYYESIGLADQAKKIQDAISLRDIATCHDRYDASDFAGQNITKDEFQSAILKYEALRDELLKEEVQRICRLFAEPLLNAGETKGTIEQIKTTIQTLLGKFE